MDLRVLKRFTFTEGDSDYQWEKLRSAFTLAEWTEPDFNNRALFSDYYLKERLTDPALTPAWGEDVRLIGREVFRHLAEARQDLSGQPEDVIRKELYEPLFGSLGFQAKVNRSEIPASTSRTTCFIRPASPTNRSGCPDLRLESQPRRPGRAP